jgi:DNA-binding beta-propeller fold protein YncE
MQADSRICGLVFDRFSGNHYKGKIAMTTRQKIIGVLKMLPGLAVMAAMLQASSCDGGFWSVASSSPNATATGTPVPGAGNFAYVSNFNDSRISVFTRNIITGALSLVSNSAQAGAAKGPNGLAITPNNQFLYVANSADDNIYQFSIGTQGALTALIPPSISNGSNTAPSQIAINTSGTFAWVTNPGNGTVSSYSVGLDGTLTANGGPIGGFNMPVGIAVHPSFSVLYVSDAGSGLIWPMTIASNGQIIKNFVPVSSADFSAVTPALIGLNSATGVLFVPDSKQGEISSFLVTASGSSKGALTPAPTATTGNVNNSPFGIAIATTSSTTLLFTANQGKPTASLNGSISAFLETGTALTLQTSVSPLNAPTTIVVDPQNAFVYATDQSDGTVSESVINGSCGQVLCGATLVATENPVNANSAPFGLALTH